ncbi:hypothetical protein METHB2_330001 [Candidatus Methylobacter favarea]|uniref:Uncharacterized protein n=1 Tax=Candidatus Methylobacter favarea TaxID=2707345 RepID=A0A8S0X156_9GAMM|nr:hypothetical protein METHB2_330001 [Candidatus Methylobacter favarea]
MLKSHGNSSIQVIVNGQVYRNQSVAAYYDGIANLKSQVRQSFSPWQQDYDRVIYGLLPNCKPSFYRN